MGRITENELSASVVAKLNKTASLSKYIYELSLASWGYSNESELYYYTLNHALNVSEEDITDLKVINDNKEEMFISYKIIDNNNLTIYSTDAFNGKLIIKY